MRLIEIVTKHPIEPEQIDEITFRADIPNTNKHVTLEFDEINPTLLGINFYVNGEVKLTGKGHQFTVAAIVLKIINEQLLNFITDEIETVFFSAKVEKNDNYSRINLYKKQGVPIISNLLNSIGKWEFELKEYPTESHFIWERVNEEEETASNTSPFLMNEFKNPDEKTIKKYKNYRKVTPYTFEYTLSNGKLLELYFLKRKDYYYDDIVLNIIFSIDNRFDLTKMRGAFEALNVVRTILNNELLNQITPDINYIKITADTDEPSRIEFYKKYAVPLISNIIQENWKFKGTTNDLHEIEFYWERKKMNASSFTLHEVKNLNIEKYKNYTKTAPDRFEYLLSNDKLLEVIFARDIDDKNKMTILFKVDEEFRLTNGGLAAEVLNVVRTILLNELLDQVKPNDNTIVISADINEPSRYKFYRKYAEPLISQILQNDWVHTEIIGNQEDVIFVWKRKNQQLNEGLNLNKAHTIISKFLKFVKQQLKLDELPKIHLITDTEHSIEQSSFGGYSNGHVYLTIGNRHINDCLRSLAHELVHYKQDLEGRIKKDSGKDGSPEENEANAKAAVILRKWGKKYPSLFGLEAIEPQN